MKIIRLRKRRTDLQRKIRMLRLNREEWYKYLRSRRENSEAARMMDAYNEWCASVNGYRPYGLALKGAIWEKHTKSKR